MKPTSNSRKLFFIIGILAVALIVAWFAGFRVNATPSLPLGIYKYSSGTPQKGDLVAFCLGGEGAKLAAEREYVHFGSCPSGLRPLLKQLAGLPGDFVDPAALPIRSVDSQGRSMSPVLTPGVIPPGMALVLADHPGSFDSRYFGFVPLDSLQRNEPVFIFNLNSKGK